MKNRTVKNRRLIEHEKLSLNEWLDYINIPRDDRDFDILDCQFATDAHLEEYISIIQQRPDKEVKNLLSLFLIEGGHLGHDRQIRSSLLQKSIEEQERLMSRSTFLQRIVRIGGKHPPWPSIQWIVDLLPEHPQQAIDAINSYFQAHCAFMPDGRMHGMSDAEEIIRAKYMKHALPIKHILLDRAPRDFELLVGYLYNQKGYSVEITPRSKDGGYDILAETNSDRAHERLHIECKRYEQNIGVQIVRQVLGTLSVNNATKAVIVATTGFTQPAKDEAHKSKRIELIDINEFDSEMRENVDYQWPLKITRFLMDMQKTYNKSLQRTSS
ncbi:MAG: restriction endonuclease [Pseudomonas sp.]|nr:restriction endonuclease [Pseudomonas sp.]MAQ50595.1 restriction endonuclease [Pseudomonas sp.]MBB49394.1 restriction endonuclease [Pseudomonadales bacterium]|tara:strand:+ start:437 stop:1417 length:981 start_codon:yes stop_codon:yes gene_type:complete